MKYVHKELPILIDHCLETLRRKHIEIHHLYKIPNGYCIFRDEKRLYIDCSLTDTDKFKALIEVLSALDLEDIFISPCLREHIRDYNKKPSSQLIYDNKSTISRKKKLLPKPVTIKREKNYAFK